MLPSGSLDRVGMAGPMVEVRFEAPVVWVNEPLGQTDIPGPICPFCRSKHAGSIAGNTYNRLDILAMPIGKPPLGGFPFAGLVPACRHGKISSFGEHWYCLPRFIIAPRQPHFRRVFHKNVHNVPK